MAEDEYKFDGDLFTLLPRAREILAGILCEPIITTGSYHPGHGISADVWNHKKGFIAFYGFRGPCRPAVYVSSKPIIDCIFEQAIRDCWINGYILMIDRRFIFDGCTAAGPFMQLLQDKRGISKLTPGRRHELRMMILSMLRQAVKNFKVARNKSK
jgi:hypothetical protein